MKPSELLQKMIDAGATPEACVIALQALEEVSGQDQERRDKAAERKRRSRAKSRDGHGTVTAQKRDGADPLPSPHTPQPTPSPSKNPPKGGQKGSLSPSCREAFDRIWKRLPQQARRSGEIACLPAFARAVASGADPAEIEAAVGPWLEKSGDCVERFDRWVENDLWREWLPAKRSAPATDGEWRSFVGYFQRRGEWCAPGPAPGQPGCQVPADVLAEFGYSVGDAA